MPRTGRFLATESPGPGEREGTYCLVVTGVSVGVKKMFGLKTAEMVAQQCECS